MRMLVPGQAVRANHGGGMREDAAHVVLIDAVIDGACGLKALGCVELAEVPFGGDVGESSPACDFGVRRRSR